jgi:hypothetical protein
VITVAYDCDRIPQASDRLLGLEQRSWLLWGGDLFIDDCLCLTLRSPLPSLRSPHMRLPFANAIEPPQPQTPSANCTCFNFRSPSGKGSGVEQTAPQCF